MRDERERQIFSPIFRRFAFPESKSSKLQSSLLSSPYPADANVPL